MLTAKTNNHRILILLPIFGIIIFIIFYITAASYYPGGSQADKNATGFSWLNNYWCNFLNQYAINGQYNSARPIAVTAMVILCVSLSVFWCTVPLLFQMHRRSKNTIKIAGVIAMAVSLFLFTAYHTWVVNIAGVFGAAAVIGTLIGLYKSKLLTLFSIGILCLLLVVINNYFYYSAKLIFYLPVVQKITFFIFLSWIVLINMTLFRKLKTGQTIT